MTIFAAIGAAVAGLFALGLVVLIIMGAAVSGEVRREEELKRNSTGGRNYVE